VTPRSSLEVPFLRWIRNEKCFSRSEVLEEARQSRGGGNRASASGRTLAQSLALLRCYFNASAIEQFHAVGISLTDS